MKEPIKVAIAGLGNRGMDIYAHYAHFAPDEMQVVAAAEPIREKLEKAKKEYNIPAENCFSTVEELLQAPKLADVLVIATQDQYHVSQAIPALEKGYHILCEKPISPNLEECLKLRDKAHECHRSVAIGHVLRYTPFFSKIKELIQEGRIGDVVSVQGIENVMYWHQAHSYVRGNWRDSTTSSPMILAKSCHDLDIFVWLLDKKCERLSSYGSLSICLRSPMHQRAAPSGVWTAAKQKKIAPTTPKKFISPVHAPESGTSLQRTTRMIMLGPATFWCRS